eukprot:Tamp_25283.p2 GENE.Tamp_25283~~Tamp_25283.p2  ORF type:complete len:165 (+),score=20.61 Tamp_25283:205-699(+)
MEGGRSCFASACFRRRHGVCLLLHPRCRCASCAASADETSPLRFSARGSALVGEGGGAVLVKSPSEHGGCPETTGVAVSKGTSEGAGWAVGALMFLASAAAAEAESGTEETCEDSTSERACQDEERDLQLEGNWSGWSELQVHAHMLARARARTHTAPHTCHTL